MIRISQLKLRPDHNEKALDKAVRRELRIGPDTPLQIRIVRQSVDARKKPDIFYIYTVDVRIAGEEKILKKVSKNKNITAAKEVRYRFPVQLDASMQPVICGSGPAGLFCALMLAQAGAHPIVLERGARVERRTEAVAKFWETGVLDPSSNVQFGEGGAGTFSDGKLNSMIKEKSGRMHHVMETFVRFGADESILYSYKPHVGTDVLEGVVRGIREEIIRLGGTFYFETQLTDIERSGDTMHLTLRKNGEEGRDGSIETKALVLAIGHSARDTFEMLFDKGFEMTPKSFAVGVRVEHPQKAVNDAMYGPECPYEMGAAPYKLTHKLANGDGVYSFCMCPGGYVVNASSEAGMLAVNGMSYSDRGGINANSAIVMTVDPTKYTGSDDPLCGIRFQRELEKKAFELAGGAVPYQRFADFRANRASESYGSIVPNIKGIHAPANVRSIFPKEIAAGIEEGILSFERMIKGYSGDDTLLEGVESRTSSPVRIQRDEHCVSTRFDGVFPCGEGAGYAGGITSAAVDGIRVAENTAAFLAGVDFKME